VTIGVDVCAGSVATAVVVGCGVAAPGVAVTCGLVAGGSETGSAEGVAVATGETENVGSIVGAGLGWTLVHAANAIAAKKTPVRDVLIMR
jgi:hypothetical protein